MQTKTNDLTNRKSLVNITQWAEEVLGGDQESGANVPLVLVGTKQNEVPVAKRNEITERSRRTAEEIGAEHINLDSMDSKVLMPGSSVKIGSFIGQLLQIIDILSLLCI